MKTLLPNNSLTKYNGFTLLEIMVVLIIIGIMLSIALLAFGDFGQTRRVRLAANEIAMFIKLAEQQAILQPAVLGLELKEDGFEFHQIRYDPKNHDYKWQTLTDDPILKYRQWPNGVKVRLLKHGQAPIPLKMNANPQIIITTTGNITPFVMEFMNDNNRVLYKVIGQESGIIKVIK